MRQLIYEPTSNHSGVLTLSFDNRKFNADIKTDEDYLNLFLDYLSDEEGIVKVDGLDCGKGCLFILHADLIFKISKSDYHNIQNGKPVKLSSEDNIHDIIKEQPENETLKEFYSWYYLIEL
jgi:hypothetical protein